MAETKEIIKAVRNHGDVDMDMEIQKLEMLNYMIESCSIGDDGGPAPCFDEIDKSRIRKKMFDIIDGW